LRYILLDIVQKGNGFDYSIRIFADSYNLCAHEELIRPNELPFLLKQLIVVVWRIHLLVNAVTGISTGADKTNYVRAYLAPMPKHHSNHAQVYRCSDMLIYPPALLLLYQIFSTLMV
jgi:hypothetical protein